MTADDRIQLADALDWLPRQPAGAARAIVLDPPYSRYSPMRGREDGAAGSVSAPFSFLHKIMGLCARAVMPDGVVIIFGDFKLLPDLEYICSVTGLREQAHLVWCRSRPGGGGLFRGACDPVLIASRTPPAELIRRRSGTGSSPTTRSREPIRTASRPRSSSTSCGGCAAAATWSSIRSRARAARGPLRRSSGWTSSGAVAT